MNIKHKDYQTHLVFKTLKKCMNFYNNLAYHICLWASIGTTGMMNMDTYIFSSLKGTIDAINILLRKGRINDAWSLLRKYHDAIIIHTYVNLYLKSNYKTESLIVEKINKWRDGSEKIPEYRIMSSYIKRDNSLKKLNKILYETDNRYKNIRNLANNNTHYNFFKNFILNDNELHLDARISQLEDIDYSIRELFILHISYIFSIQGHYMMGSDYIDYLECGDIPPKDSQYWIAPFIQEIFNNTIEAHRPDIAQLIKESTSMHLE